MNSEMQQMLSLLVSKDVLVSIYTDTDAPDSFTLGYLLQMDNDNILLNMIDSFGEENGFCTIRLSDVFIFDGDKLYSEKMHKLFMIKKQQRKYIDLDESPFASLLKHAEGNNQIIEVNEDDNYRGYVSYFSKETLVLNLVGNYCNDLGTATIDMTNINTLKCQSRLLKDLELLYNTK
ncbi:MAG: hypothetical protein CVU91_06730 [Firmicutes bacterium HGW-Firmicutes-16]|nr:MAG: hypothetical protein CVU91_06730 [Firmicutes bacterium HGW-Firmicutes-16]